MSDSGPAKRHIGLSRTKWLLAIGAIGVVVAVVALQVLASRWLRPPPRSLAHDAGVPVDAAIERDRTHIFGRIAAATGVAGERTIDIHQNGVRQSQPLDADGGFAFAIAPGPFALYAYSADRRWQALRCVAAAEGTAADGGLPNPTDLTWSPAVALAGEISDGSRHPIGAASLVWRPAGCDVEIAAVSDVHGQFTVQVPAEPGTITVEADLYWPLTQAVPAHPPKLHFAMIAAGALSGTVRDEQGRPVANARLALATAEGGSASASSMMGGGGGALDPRVRPSGELGVLIGSVPFPPITTPPSITTAVGETPLLTDDHGHFSVARVVVGAVTVQAVHPQFASVTAQIVIRPGERTTVELTLLLGSDLDGNVRDADDNPLDGSDVALLDGSSTRSDRAGHFVLHHVLPGQSLEVRRAGYRPGRVTISSEPTLTIRLERADHRLAGAVVDEKGYPVAGAEVVVTEDARAVTDRDGHFAVPGLGAPPYSVHVTHAGFAPLLATLPDESDARLELRWGAGIDGTVRDDRTGDVPPGARLELIGSGAPVELRLVRGRFSSTGLLPGHATLHATAPGWVDVRQTVELPAGSHAAEVTLRDVDLRLERGGIVTGLVISDDGQPVSDVDVQAGERHGRTDHDGRFRLEGVPTGKVHVRSGAIDSEVEVRRDEESSVELRRPR